MYLTLPDLWMRCQQWKMWDSGCFIFEHKVSTYLCCQIMFYCWDWIGIWWWGWEPKWGWRREPKQKGTSGTSQCQTTHPLIYTPECQAEYWRTSAKWKYFSPHQNLSMQIPLLHLYDMSGKCWWKTHTSPIFISIHGQWLLYMMQYML